MGHTPYCRRHIGIARALQLDGGDDEIRPDIDNRAPSLCEWVANVIHARVLDLLAEMRGSQASITITADRLGLVIEGTPRVRYWERNWKLTDHQGTVIKLAVRVAEPVDRELILMAGREVLSTEVPPWVGQRVTDEATREAFHDALMERLRTGAAAYLRRNAVGLRGRMENLPA
jgi:hypothetical protein